MLLGDETGDAAVHLVRKEALGTDGNKTHNTIESIAELGLGRDSNGSGKAGLASVLERLLGHIAQNLFKRQINSIITSRHGFGSFFDNDDTAITGNASDNGERCLFTLADVRK